ncbi:MAG: hypothetical protein ISR65_11435 [Bacteriovoracaceae bacterium]|nr:hypothetical protein [Bacteriovoracaceae bacterium]
MIIFNSFIKFLLIGILTFGLTLSLHAKKFTSQYCEFELPPGWECALEGTEWVCQSQNVQRRKEAIIILAAKIRGSQDSLDLYKAYLKKVKTFTLPGGKVQVSEPKYTKAEDISKHPWVDSLHLASEVPGFYTRYLATVKADLGVAVTFSCSKDHYGAYKPLFDKMVASLKVFRQKAKGDFKYKGKRKDADLLGSTFVPDVDQKFDLGSQRKGRGGAGASSDSTSYMIYGAIAVAILLVLLKLKGGKKKKKKGKKKKE